MNGLISECIYDVIAIQIQSLKKFGIMVQTGASIKHGNKIMISLGGHNQRIIAYQCNIA